LKAFDISRGFLIEAHEYQSELKVSTWIGGLAMFELAVLDLKEAEDRDRKQVTVVDIEKEEEDGTAVDGYEDMNRVWWTEVLKAACVKLDWALDLATNVDLSSRLDSRIAMLKDEIAAKREIHGIHA